jgi:ribosomal protein L16/L10AE
MGDFGLIASESGYITSQQIESLRIFLRRKFKMCAYLNKNISERSSNKKTE